MTCFNRREVTIRCLDQLQRQSALDMVDLSIFVVDDGSSDGTTGAILEQFPSVRVISGTGSLYWTGGMHLADEVAWVTKPDYLLWLNDDVQLEPTAIRVLLDASELAGDGAIVVGALRSPGTETSSYGGYRRPDRSRPMQMDRVEPNGQLQDVDTMNGNVVLIPARVRASAGPPDLSFSHNMADMDYAFRAAGSGWRVCLAPNFVGTCETNPGKARWRDPSVPLRGRFQLLISPKGLPPREWLAFTRRHCGWRWPRCFLGPYGRALLAGVVAKRDALGDEGLAVLHVLNELKRSGAEVMLISGGSALTAAGAQSTILSHSSGSDDRVVQRFLSAGFAVEHLPPGRLGSVVIGYWRILTRVKPDCVHVHAERMSMVTCLIPRLRRVGVIRTVHSSFDFGRMLRLRKTIERGILALAGVRTISVSPSVQANEMASFRNRSQVILNWYDEKAFMPPSPEEVLAARQAFGLGPQRVAIAVVGNCSPVKNHSLILEALSLLPAHERPMLLHVGDGVSCPKERVICTDLGLNDDVLFLGSLDAVAPVLHAADAFAMPSIYEGIGVAPIEGLATGLPTLVSPAPGLSDLASMFAAVRTVEWEPARWAEALRELRRLNLSSQERENQSVLVRQRLGVERGVREYVDTYRAVTRTTRRRSAAWFAPRKSVVSLPSSAVVESPTCP